MHFFSKQTTKSWIEIAHKRISSSGVILEDDDGKLLTVKIFYKPYWTVPGGLIDEGETPKHAAAREVFEEVGVKLNEDDLAFVLVADRISKELQTYQFIFKARLTNEAKKGIIPQADEVEEYAFVTRSQVNAGDRNYAKAVQQWAEDTTGYVEQTFGD